MHAETENSFSRPRAGIGNRKKYKAHISKYVRHILKYLRHIFCRPGNPPGKSPGNADKNGGRLLAPGLPARSAPPLPREKESRTPRKGAGFMKTCMKKYLLDKDFLLSYDVNALREVPGCFGSLDVAFD